MPKPELIALYKHWIRVDSMKYVLLQKDEAIPELKGLPQELREFALIATSVPKLETLYGLLYVVIEGYRELGCSYPKVDELLVREDYVDALRRFRNAVFHYQKQPINEKLLGFLEAAESEKWIQQLHSAFEEFLLSVLPIEEMAKKYSGNGT